MKVESVTGATGLAPGVHPAAADKSSFRVLNNMVCDIPGFAIKRRGLEDVTDPESNGTGETYSALWLAEGITDMRPIQAWSFDNSIFIYFENQDESASGIAQFEMTKYLNWQVVAVNDSAANQVRLMLDSDKFKMRTKAFDRTLLINTTTGIKRMASLAHDFPEDQSGNQWDYSTAYRDAGIPPALDCRIPNVVTADNTEAGLHPTDPVGQEWLPPRSSVSFKICWVRRDENGRLVTGKPSGRTIIRNVSTTDSYAVSMLIPIPTGADEKFVMQEFRTRVISEDANGGIPDPGDDHYQAGERRLTAADLAAGFILFEDLSFDPLLGQALYVNPGQEGPTQGREQPPLARDIENFGNCAWYANTNERVGLSVKFLAVNDGSLQAGIAVGDLIEAGDLIMECVDPADEFDKDWYFAADDTTGIGSEVVRAIKTAESFAYKYNLFSNKWGGRFWAHCATTNDDIYGVVNFVEKEFHRIPQQAEGGSADTFSHGPGAHSPVYVGVNRIDIPTQILPAPVFTDAPDDTLMVGCTVTSDGTTTVVLSDLVTPTTLIVGDRIFLAPYGATTDSGSQTPYPSAGVQPMCANSFVLSGAYTVTAVTGTTVSVEAEYLTAIGVDTFDQMAFTGAYFHKIFDITTAMETEARSAEARCPSALFFSASGEPEGVPRLNKMYIGGPDAAILRIMAITTSMFVFKEDGLWRIQGTDGQWIVNAVDPTCRLIAPESVQTVAGRVYAYSALGVVQVTESGVSKVSTNIGGNVDSLYRIAAADPTVARRIVSCANIEDNAYLLGIPIAPIGAADETQSNIAVYRYHVPSRSWSKAFYRNNKYSGAVTDPGNPSTNTGAFNIAALTTFRQTRFQIESPARNYIERMVVAMGEVSDCIGIERRDGTAIDYCDFQVILSAPTAWDPVTMTMTFTSALPASVVAGSVLWVHDGYTDRRYRATIASVGASSVVLEPVVLQTAYTLWPDLATILADYDVSILLPITAAAQYVPQAAGQGFEADHVSEVLVEFGSRGRFSTASLSYQTDKNDTVGTATVAGLAYKEWSDWIVRAEDTQTELRTVRAYVPREVARGTQFRVTIGNSKAWEVFDVSGQALIVTDPSHKVRRTL